MLLFSLIALLFLAGCLNNSQTVNVSTQPQHGSNTNSNVGTPDDNTNNEITNNTTTNEGQTNDLKSLEDALKAGLGVKCTITIHSSTGTTNGVLYFKQNKKRFDMSAQGNTYTIIEIDKGNKVEVYMKSSAMNFNNCEWFKTEMSRDENTNDPINIKDESAISLNKVYETHTDQGDEKVQCSISDVSDSLFETEGMVCNNNIQ